MLLFVGITKLLALLVEKELIVVQNLRNMEKIEKIRTSYAASSSLSMRK